LPENSGVHGRRLPTGTTISFNCGLTRVSSLSTTLNAPLMVRLSVASQEKSASRPLTSASPTFSMNTRNATLAGSNRDICRSSMSEV
jgi:hypothetical protein